MYGDLFLAEGKSISRAFDVVDGISSFHFYCLRRLLLAR
jgi:hypothetical protein